jgi:hypothetical protein
LKGGLHKPHKDPLHFSMQRDLCGFALFLGAADQLFDTDIENLGQTNQGFDGWFLFAPIQV